MGKKKFLDKKKFVMFVFMYREMEGVDDDVVVCVFICVDGGFILVLGFLEEDLCMNFDYGYEIDEGVLEGEDGVEELLVFVDVDEDDDVKFVWLWRFVVLRLI